MASTTSLLTGLSGLTAHARRLEVIGNNIANVNTTAYKSNRLVFAPTFSRTLNAGTAPTANSGGTNPGQIGLGVTQAGTQRNFQNGALSVTGGVNDLAIEGDGMFIVDRDGEQVYTRAGAFQLNSQRELVTISGERVLGFPIDDDFKIVEGTLQPLTIPIGALTLAQATQTVRFAGNLNADGPIGKSGTEITFDQPFLDVADSVTPLTGASLLTSVDDPGNPGTALFSVGQSIVLTNVQKGGKNIPDATFTIGATSTVNDLLQFFNDAMGITEGVTNPSGQTTGATIDASGVIHIVGNTGTANHLVMEPADFEIRNAAGVLVGTPFTFTEVTPADGESVRTTFQVFDSLGTPLAVDLVLTLESKSNSGTTWRYDVESGDDTDLDISIATGTVSFDTKGRMVGSGQVNIQIDRDNTGAIDPLAVGLQLISQSDEVTALTDTGGVSTLASTFQDGAPLGVLASYSFASDGTINGAFDNGLTRTIGRVMLATFTNPEGLVDIGDNLFRTGPNSGTPVISQGGSFGAGRIVGGALELSNVDLGSEFINMILTTTGYSASSRVIQTTDQLLQQLVALGG